MALIIVLATAAVIAVSAWGTLKPRLERGTKRILWLFAGVGVIVAAVGSTVMVFSDKPVEDGLPVAGAGAAWFGWVWLVHFITEWVAKGFLDNGADQGP